MTHERQRGVKHHLGWPVFINFVDQNHLVLYDLLVSYCTKYVINTCFKYAWHINTKYCGKWFYFGGLSLQYILMHDKMINLFYNKQFKYEYCYFKNSSKK